MINGGRLRFMYIKEFTMETIKAFFRLTGIYYDNGRFVSKGKIEVFFHFTLFKKSHLTGIQRSFGSFGRRRDNFMEHI